MRGGGVRGGRGGGGEGNNILYVRSTHILHDCKNLTQTVSELVFNSEGCINIIIRSQTSCIHCTVRENEQLLYVMYISETACVKLRV